MASWHSSIMEISGVRHRKSLDRWRMIGVVMWRGGLVFAAAYTFYWGSWQLIRQLEWPLQITLGLALALAGLGLVMVSLVFERMRAARTEGNLLDD
ncbi:MAG TPA: hypothetical protein VKO38_02050 [Wenzhouxiangella sp.]|nr:hypothetical protein [Wenzhouxiangella sp.]